MTKFHSYFYNVMLRKEKGIVAAFLRALLLCLSFVFQSVVAVRNYFYDKGILKSKSPENVFIISIGNIVAGGAGKTPSTIMLAKAFIKKMPLAIISRGYRSLAEKKSEPTIVSEGKGPKCSAEVCGDEPYLMANALPTAYVIVGKNRRKAAQIAAEAGMQLIICDDAMQHRSLYRDADVVIINALDPIGQGYFLPRGFLRDSLKSLARADLLIINHVINVDHFAALKAELSKYTKAPMIGTQLKVDKILDSNCAEVSIKNKKVAIFCGIAHPENFRKTIVECGSKIVLERVFSDHLTFSKEALVDFAQQAQQKGADLLLCTEKDFVKLQEHPPLPLPLAYLKMKMEIVTGHNVWNSFLTNIQNEISSKKSYQGVNNTE